MAACGAGAAGATDRGLLLSYGHNGHSGRQATGTETGGGRGAQATPTPSSAVPQDVRHTLPGPAGPPTSRPTSRAPSGEGSQRGLLQLRLTQPSVPATSSGSLSPLPRASWPVPPRLKCRLSRGPGQSSEGLGGLRPPSP